MSRAIDYTDYTDARFDRRKDALSVSQLSDNNLLLREENERLRQMLMPIGMIAIKSPTSNELSYISTRLCKEVALYLGLIHPPQNSNINLQNLITSVTKPL